MRAGKFLLPAAGCFIIFCAFRENPYDPASPYHREPLLKYTLEYDTLKTKGKSSEDHILAVAPFTITIFASSQDFFHPADTLPVVLEHFFKNSISIDSSWPKFTVKFDKDEDSGSHHLKLISRSSYGTTASRHIRVNIELSRQPIVLSFKLSPDTIELDPWLEIRPPVYFYTKMYDPDHLADSIFYKLGDIFRPWPSHPLRVDDTNLADTIFDTAFFSFSEKKERIKELYKSLIADIQVVIKDSLGRETRAVAPLVFSEKRILRGFPPRIDSIFIINKPPVITVGQQVCFGIDAVDYSDQDSKPKDSTLLIFDWDFGDGTITGKKYPCNTYSSPGNYIVMAIVTDDSWNTDTASMIVQVEPSRVIRPYFKTFSVKPKSTSTVAPCRISISVSAEDDDGYINSLFIYVQGQKIDIDTTFTSVTDWQYILPTAGTYDILALVFDNEGNYRDTSTTIVVTDSE